jgi:hypothetical protein
MRQLTTRWSGPGIQRQWREKLEMRTQGIRCDRVIPRPLTCACGTSAGSSQPLAGLEDRI